MTKRCVQRNVQQQLHQISLDSWSESNISTEGIGDIFSKITKTIKDWNDNRIRRRAKPDPLRHRNIQMSWYWIASAIKKTYLNSVWLDARKSVTEPIDATKYIQGLIYDDFLSQDAHLLIVGATDITKAIADFIPARDAYIQAFEREVMDGVGNKKFVDYLGRTDVRALSAVVDLFFRTHGTVSDLANRTLGKMKVQLPENYVLSRSVRGLQVMPGKVSTKHGTKLVPLTKDQIVSSARLMLEAIEQVPKVYVDTDSLLLNIIDDYVVEYVDEDEVVSDVVATALEIKKAFAQVNNPELRMLLDEMAWNEHFYVPILKAFDQLVKGLISTEQYMADSID